MKLAFCLYKYFPYGGMQRNFLAIARECLARGHQVRVYVLEWQGAPPEELEIVHVPAGALRNIRRYRQYSAWVAEHLAEHPVDRVVGFNKMPGLDVYYAADPCYAEKALTQRGKWYRFGARYRHFMDYEKAVFGPQSDTVLMLLSQPEREIFDRHYQLDPDRVRMLPPGISADRRAPGNASEIRRAFRQQQGVADDELILLQIGSDFVRKGVDRTLRAMAALPVSLRERTRLLVVGEADAAPMEKLALGLGLDQQVRFVGGREDILPFLLGADLFMHPAYHENTGNVILEAMVAGLPPLVSGICGYAHHVIDADAGWVVAEPFSQTALNQVLARILGDHDLRAAWSVNALAYAEHADLYSRPARAAEVILGEG